MVIADLGSRARCDHWVSEWVNEGIVKIEIQLCGSGVLQFGKENSWNHLSLLNKYSIKKTLLKNEVLFTVVSLIKEWMWQN